MNDDRLLNVEGAAAFLGVAVATVYTWKHKGLIPFRKAGSRLLFSKEELLAWTKSNGGGPLDQPHRAGESSHGIYVLPRRKAAGSLKTEQNRIRTATSSKEIDYGDS